MAFAFPRPAPTTGIAPPIAAPVASSVGVPSRPSVSPRNFPVSITPCVAPSPTFPSVPTSFAFPKTPPGAAMESPSPVPSFAPLYPALSISAPKACAPDCCCRSASSRATCPSPPLFSPVKMPLSDTSSEKGAETTSPSIPRAPPTACDAPDAIPAPIFASVELSGFGCACTESFSPSKIYPELTRFCRACFLSVACSRSLFTSSLERDFDILCGRDTDCVEIVGFA